MRVEPDPDPKPVRCSLSELAIGEIFSFSSSYSNHEPAVMIKLSDPDWGGARRFLVADVRTGQAKFIDDDGDHVDPSVHRRKGKLVMEDAEDGS